MEIIKRHAQLFFLDLGTLMQGGGGADAAVQGQIPARVVDSK